MPEQANEERVTTPYMTKYERARILGTRVVLRLEELLRVVGVLVALCISAGDRVSIVVVGL
jgi:hypothetical protein